MMEEQISIIWANPASGGKSTRIDLGEWEEVGSKDVKRDWLPFEEQFEYVGTSSLYKGHGIESTSWLILTREEHIECPLDLPIVFQVIDDKAAAEWFVDTNINPPVDLQGYSSAFSLSPANARHFSTVEHPRTEEGDEGAWAALCEYVDSMRCTNEKQALDVMLRSSGTMKYDNFLIECGITVNADDQSHQTKLFHSLKTRINRKLAQLGFELIRNNNNVIISNLAAAEKSENR